MKAIHYKILLCYILLLALSPLEAASGKSEKKVYAQLSSSLTQIPTQNSLVSLDSVEALSGLKLINKNRIVIKEEGVYFITTTVQVGDKHFVRSGEVQLSLFCNDCPLPNSTMSKSITEWHTLDRISNHMILPLKAGDSISLSLSASAPGLGLIALRESSCDPVIPSVILSIFKVD